MNHFQFYIEQERQKHIFFLLFITLQRDVIVFVWIEGGWNMWSGLLGGGIVIGFTYIH